jgi:hypothetical protein
LPTIRYCPFCEEWHRFQLEFDEEHEVFELRCSKSGLLVEKASKEEQPDRFLELSWQFVPPPQE